MKESSYLEGQVHLVDTIKNLPVFEGVDQGKLKKLLRLSKIRQYQANEIIIAEGAKENWMYFLLSGSVQVEKEGKPLVKIDHHGDTFGEMGFLDGEPRSASVRAIKDTACLAVDASYLDQEKEEGHNSFHASIYKIFAQVLARRLRITTTEYLETKKKLDRFRGHG